VELPPLDPSDPTYLLDVDRSPSVVRELQRWGVVRRLDARTYVASLWVVRLYFAAQHSGTTLSHALAALRALADADLPIVHYLRSVGAVP
jgi:hypothetical protein